MRMLLKRRSRDLKQPCSRKERVRAAMDAQLVKDTLLLERLSTSTTVTGVKNILFKTNNYLKDVLIVIVLSVSGVEGTVLRRG